MGGMGYTILRRGSVHLACLTACLLNGLSAAGPSVTIYNDNFAVVRDTVRLDLKAGVNDVRFNETTAHVEPESVILRDPADKVRFQILEQNYRNDPVTRELLLSLFEGKTINFYIHEANKPDRTVAGKIIRSGYVPHGQQAMQRYGQRYAMQQRAMAYGSPGAPTQPIVEVDGKIQFQLPGEPIFPSLGDDTILKPALSWKINSDREAGLDAELGYVTGGMSWSADYNLVAEEKGDTLDLIGWVTVDNQSGKTFPSAKIKLMAGDVRKIQDGPYNYVGRAYAASAPQPSSPPVTERTFDEYHLYTLERATTLRDRETKQVEFLRASGIPSETIYVYDGMRLDMNQWRGYSPSSRRQSEEFGLEFDTKVAVKREFKNAKDGGLGIPLPRGRMRLYRRDGAQLEFVGEDEIDHTPKDEMVRVQTGNAFDLVGERRRTHFRLDSSNRWADESFEIKLRNHKQAAVEIRVVEHLLRWTNWDILDKSLEFKKTNAQEIQFRAQVPADGETIITYRVHYSW